MLSFHTNIHNRNCQENQPGGFEIKDIRTYAGYKGDLLVEVMATDPKVIQTIKDWAENLGMETAVKENRMTMIYELFCITPDEEVYDLIAPE